MNQPDKINNYDMLWKMRTLFDQLSGTYNKFFSPSEHLAVDEVSVPFKGSHFQTVQGCIQKFLD
jgi:hypothetical protein